MHREDRSLQSLNAESSGCPEISSAGFCWRLPPSSEGERNPHARPGALVSVLRKQWVLCRSWVLCWVLFCMCLGCYFACILGAALCASWVLFCMYLGCCAGYVLGAILHASWVLCTPWVSPIPWALCTQRALDYP